MYWIQFPMNLIIIFDIIYIHFGHLYDLWCSPFNMHELLLQGMSLTYYPGFVNTFEDILFLMLAQVALMIFIKLPVRGLKSFQF